MWSELHIHWVMSLNIKWLKNWKGRNFQRPFGEHCVYNGECHEGLVCQLEDKLFDPERICACPKNLDWDQGQCVDIKGSTISNFL